MPRPNDTPIRSLAGAISRFSKLSPADNEVIVFRGHAKHDWPMRTKILRCSDALQEREGDMARELIAVAPLAFSDDASMFDRLVRMQHFGLPTRLLDTTSNPLVALYFATEEHVNEDGVAEDGAVVVARFDREEQKYFDSDTVSCLANLGNLSHAEREAIQKANPKTLAQFNRLKAVDRLVQFVRGEKPAFRAKIVRTDLFKRLHVIPKLSNPRIVAQSGSFILFGLRRPAGMSVPIRLRRLIVSADRKKQIRRDLERLGITESSLFPELDKAASHIVARLDHA
jgi:hypothetical protein